MYWIIHQINHIYILIISGIVEITLFRSLYFPSSYRNYSFLFYNYFQLSSWMNSFVSFKTIEFFFQKKNITKQLYKYEILINTRKYWKNKQNFMINYKKYANSFRLNENRPIKWYYITCNAVCCAFSFYLILNKLIANWVFRACLVKCNDHMLSNICCNKISTTQFVSKDTCTKSQLLFEILPRKKYKILYRNC